MKKAITKIISLCCVTALIVCIFTALPLNTSASEFMPVTVNTPVVDQSTGEAKFDVKTITQYQNYVYVGVTAYVCDFAVASYQMTISGNGYSKTLLMGNPYQTTINILSQSIPAVGVDYSGSLAGFPDGEYTYEWKATFACYYQSVRFPEYDATESTTGTITLKCSHTNTKKQVGYKAPSCSEEGYYEYSCTSCNTTWREKIEKIPFSISKKEGTSLMIDENKGYIFGLAEGDTDLSGYFVMEGCSLKNNPTDGGFGTGSTVDIIAGGETVKSYTVIIYGDVTGDGIADAFDVALSAAVSNFETELDPSGPQFEAADLNEDGVLDNFDTVQLISASNYEIIIDQKGSADMPDIPIIPPVDPPVDPPVTEYEYTFNDQSYGPYGVRNLYDLYLPENVTGEVGLVLYIHGGSWELGDKEGYKGQLDAMRKKGYAGGSINYRYATPTNSLDEMLDDVTNALNSMKALAAKNGQTINKVMLVGDSAGAHISLMYAYTRTNEAEVTPVCVRGNSSPADLSIDRYKSSENTLREISYVTGLAKSGIIITPKNVNNTIAQQYIKEYSPAYHANTGIPTLLCHGAKDDGVPLEGAVNLYNALVYNNIFVDYVVYPNSGHGLDSPLDTGCVTEANNKMFSMMQTYLPAPNLAE